MDFQQDAKSVNAGNAHLEGKDGMSWQHAFGKEKWENPESAYCNIHD